ncbi:MAG TPA: ABC transporter permease subunit [Gemmatimonadales bacterium]|nr:ABC transporter permease subunit [Gemmatimonadales bacterium]
MRFSALMSHQVRRYRAVLVVLALGLALFLYISSMIATSPEMTRGGALEAMLALVPRGMLKVLGIDPATMTTAGLLSLSYVHPFVLLAAGVWAARIPSGSLAGEVGAGTMDLVASRPVARWQIVASAAITLYAGMAILMTAVWSGMAIALGDRGELDISPFRFLPLAAAQFLLFAALGSLALLCSSLARHGGEALSWSVGIMAVMFALDFISRSRESLAFLRWATLFTWVKPQEIVATGSLPAGTVGVLLLVCVAATGGALVAFGRRDL